VPRDLSARLGTHLHAGWEMVGNQQHLAVFTTPREPNDPSRFHELSHGWSHLRGVRRSNSWRLYSVRTQFRLETGTIREVSQLIRPHPMVMKFLGVGRKTTLLH